MCNLCIKATLKKAEPKLKADVLEILHETWTHVRLKAVIPLQDSVTPSFSYPTLLGYFKLGVCSLN